MRALLVEAGERRQQKKRKDAKRELAHASLLDFIEYTKPAYRAGWFHRQVCAILERFLADVLAGKRPRIIITAPPQHGKLLAMETPTFTPGGWRAHGDLKPGDFVFGRYGQPVEVLAVSEPDWADREVEFTDGGVIHCHAAHEWVVFDRRGGALARTLETRQLERECCRWQVDPSIILPQKETRRGIVDIRRCKPREGRCIQVEGGVYLAGETFIPTHNSEMVSRRFPCWAIGRHPGLRFLCGSYGATWAEQLSGDRQRILDLPEYKELFPNFKLSKRRADYLEVAGADGFMLAAGVDCGISGRSSDIGLIDDPVRGYKDAVSELTRNAIWNWYKTDFYSRLQSGGGVIVMMCMTGDTRVLRSDGSETLLRDIRPGDGVATYRDGALSTSKVLNWINHGPDSVYEIRMSSGITVKANERHPFLVRVGEELQWLRLRGLRPGQEICRVKRASGRARSVLSKAVASQSYAAAIATRTTTESVGLMEYVHPQSIPRPDGQLASSTDTASVLKSTTESSLNRPDCARSVGSHREKTYARIGAASCAWITATIRAPFARFSATTATSPPDTFKPPTPQKLSQLTSDFTLDRIEEIRAAKSEDVFDIEVAETENFIASGLVSHNTRWHMDDLIGRLLDEARAGSGDQWQEYNFPAFAEEDEPNRRQGEPLSPERYDQQSLESIKRVQGSYAWSALYQGRPTPAEGLLLRRDYWRYWNANDLPQFELIVISLDCTFKVTTDSDHVSLLAIGFVGSRGYLLDRTCERMGYVATKAEALRLARKHKAHVLLIEDAANGPAVCEELRRNSGQLTVIPLPTEGGKLARAWPFSADLEAGNVLLPEDQNWSGEIVDYASKFPATPMDHDIDALTQAFNWRRENLHGLFAYYEAEANRIVNPDQKTMVKVALAEETPACPQCQSFAVRLFGSTYRCNQCGVEWQKPGAEPEAPTTRARQLT